MTYGGDVFRACHREDHLLGRWFAQRGCEHDGFHPGRQIVEFVNRANADLIDEIGGDAGESRPSKSVAVALYHWHRVGKGANGLECRCDVLQPAGTVDAEPNGHGVRW